MSLRSMTLGLLATSLSVAAIPAHADEGMWTFDGFPRERMQKDYGWAPDQQWLDNVRASAVRLTNGCSA
ncbi:MAG: S46 family peptidase, partial [Erythrobacter sp.]